MRLSHGIVCKQSCQQNDLLEGLTPLPVFVTLFMVTWAGGQYWWVFWACCLWWHGLGVHTDGSSGPVGTWWHWLGVSTDGPSGPVVYGNMGWGSVLIGLPGLLFMVTWAGGQNWWAFWACWDGSYFDLNHLWH